MSEKNRVYNSGNGLPETLVAFKNRPCALLFDDPNYEPPLPEEISQLIKLAGWSQIETAKMAGVSYNLKKGSTAVRKWRSPIGTTEHRKIAFSSWRLLLLYAGVVSIETNING